jgi:hypothetical protein
VDEWGVDGYGESGEKARRAARDPSAQKVDDDDRGESEQ